jgi:ATP synthase F1 delta subunit
MMHLKPAGSTETIRARLESYLPYFDGASDVLDVGCGRGEFLDLLQARGVTGRGLDLNHEMVEVCRARGLDVAEGDVVSYLESLPDASLGGLFAAQVVEHLQPGYLLRFLELVIGKHRERLLEEIVLAWTELLDVRANRQTATVTTAIPPDPETVARVHAALEKATGKTIVLEQRVDPKLLGGLVIRTGDTVIDGSLRSRLVELGRRLRTAGQARVALG